MSDRNECGAFFLGLITGGLIGAVVGLLFTPDTGSENRATLRDKAIELRGRGRLAIKEARDQAEALTREARARSAELQTERPASSEMEAAEPPVGPGGGRPEDQY
jgi:gas vesicle protein